MKVVIFGATGAIGALAVAEALRGGHVVTAFARRPEALNLRHDRLRLCAGDALDAEAVAAAISGQDAVIVTLGAGMSLTGRVRSAGTMNIINAMQRHGVRRLICQSTLGAHESWSNLNFFWKRIMFGLLLRRVFQDHELQEQLVRASGLDWTIVRPSAFANRAGSDDYQEGFAPDLRGLSLKIAKPDVARFLTRQLSDLRYAGRAVGISN